MKPPRLMTQYEAREAVFAYLARPYAQHHPQMDADLNHRETDARMRVIEGMLRDVVDWGADLPGDYAEPALQLAAERIPGIPEGRT